MHHLASQILKMLRRGGRNGLGFVWNYLFYENGDYCYFFIHCRAPRIGSDRQRRLHDFRWGASAVEKA